MDQDPAPAAAVAVTEEAVLDLATLDVRAFASKGAELEFYHPVTRKGTGIFAKIIGRDSDEFQTWVFTRAEEKASQAQAQRRRRTAPAEEEFSAQGIYADQIEEAAFCMRDLYSKTASGEHRLAVLDGAPVTFNNDKAKEILHRFNWMLEQVVVGIGNRGVFMPASATN